MYFRKMKKQGFTLIEILSSLFIFALYATFSVSILFSFVGSYVRETEAERQDLYQTQGMLTLSSLFKEGEANIADNGIKICENQDEYKEITYNSYSNKLVVDYYKNNIKVTSNNLMLEVKDFYIIQNKNVFYMFITSCNGRRYKRCFPLKSQEEKASV